MSFRSSIASTRPSPTLSRARCAGSTWRIDRVADNVVPEKRKHNLIDDLGDRCVWDGRSVEQELFAQYRSPDLEASGGYCRGVDLPTLDRATGDLVHGAKSSAAGVLTQLKSASRVRESV